VARSNVPAAKRVSTASVAKPRPISRAPRKPVSIPDNSSDVSTDVVADAEPEQSVPATAPAAAENAAQKAVGKAEKKRASKAKGESRSQASESLLKSVDLGVWRVDGRPSLREDNASSTPGNSADQKATEAATRILRERLRKLQDRLIADGSQSLLLVLQAMDAGGKDGTVKNIYFGLNPSAAAVYSFTVPSEEELAHDFLWRIHARTPSKGTVVIFNRSHYEDVLAVRVRKIAPPTVWRPRYEQIRNFESTLVANRTKVVKVMLHISNEEQQKRLQARIDRPEKRWKFRMGDLEDRALWSDYKRAYQDAIVETNTTFAPWYIVPADQKWYRDYAILTILVNILEGMNLKYPEFANLDGLKIP
jgi:PPK2 family polyphosphate:nucleotide phosphotransferase